MTTPLVGRAAELAELDRLVRAAAAGVGGVVTIEGEAGIGKTALLDELARRAALDHGATVLRGRAWEEGGAPPYWPWREIAAAGAWPVTWDGHVDAFELYQGVAAAARAAAVAADGALVLVVDDLHAADADTLRLTRYVARVLLAAPALVVLATRPSERVASVTRLGELLLPAPLCDADADALVEAIAPGSVSAAERRRIRAAGEGNPLFLRELTRQARTGRPLPHDVIAAVAPAVNDLAPTAQALLDTAAVLGRVTPLERVAATAGMTAVAVLQWIEPLRRAGVLVVTGVPPVLSFSHQLVRDAVYEAIELHRRLALHAAAADALDGAGTDEAGVDVSAVQAADRAHHLLAAVPLVPAARAVAAALAAAAAARRALAFADAADLLERAVALTAEDASRLPLLVELGADQRRAGQVAAASQTLDEAVVVARARGTAADLAGAVLARTELVAWGKPGAQLLPLLDDALVRVDRDATLAPGDPDVLRVRLRARRAALAATGTELDGTVAEARAAVAAARALAPGRAEVLAEALAAAHRCCWRPDLLEESRALSRELADVATRLGDAERVSEALLAVLIDDLRAGDIAAADRALARYEAFASATGQPRHRFFAVSRRAMRAFLAGRLAEGDLLIEQALQLGQHIEEPDAVPVYHGARMLVVDQLETAEETLANARIPEAFAVDGEPRLNLHAAHGYLRAGALDDARRALAALHAAVPLTLDHLPLFDLCLAAEVAAAVGAHDIARSLLGVLAPHAGCCVVNAGAVTFGGVVDDYLGQLEGALGDPRAAAAHTRAALARYVALGATVLEHRARARLERSTADRHGAAAPARSGHRSVGPSDVAVLRRDGDHWEVGLGASRFVLRDGRGLHHLHALLARPGQDVAATDLVGWQASELAAREAHHALLDDRAKAAYRRRIAELRAELERADDAADVERSARAAAELDLLVGELRRAVGLGGRDRPAGATSERARVAVRKAIAAALDRVADHDPHLAHLLRATVRTGHRCRYEPDPLHPVRWELG